MGLFCCYGGTRCERGPFVADGAEPDDDLVFPISIGKTVGLGAPNDREDVKTIQKALNRFPESMGGPKPKLKPNGIVGQLTVGAIEKFQRRQVGFTNQKIDPDIRPFSGSSFTQSLGVTKSYTPLELQAVEELPLNHSSGALSGSEPVVALTGSRQLSIFRHFFDQRRQKRYGADDLRACRSVS
jgi:hypothetical protein